MKAFLQADNDHFDFHWNVDSAVGKGGPNSNPADVQYIQFYYTLAGAHPATPVERRTVYQRVHVGDKCLGIDGDPLVEAIRMHQQTLSHPVVDGRISVATSGGKITDSSAFFVIRLGARFAKMFPNLWPRVDMIPGCPQPVASAVQAAIPSPPNLT